MDNPADCLSRGCSVNQLNHNELWLRGPIWLSNNGRWPTQIFNTIISCPSIAQNQEVVLLFDPKKINNLDKLRRVTKLVCTAVSRFTGEWLRLANTVLLDNNSSKGELFTEYIFLECKSRDRIRNLVNSLRFFFEYGLRRTCGRIDKATLDYDTKHPILLLGKHYITKLIIDRWCHRAVLYRGVADILNKLREKFWLPTGRQKINSLFKNCYVCKRLESHRFHVPALPLPVDSNRSGLVSSSYYKNGRQLYKGLCSTLHVCCN